MADEKLTSMTLPEVVPTAILLSFLFTVTARMASHALPSCKVLHSRLGIRHHRKGRQYCASLGCWLNALDCSQTLCAAY